MAAEQLSFKFDAIGQNPALYSVDEIWDRATPAMLSAIKEGCKIERKPAGIHAPQLAEWLVMWANTPPDGGLIALGMADDGSLAGCSKEASEHLNRLEQAGRVQASHVPYEVKRLTGERPDGEPDFLVLFRVRYSDRRVAEDAKGNAFIRYGDAKYRLSEDEKRELSAKKGQFEYEQDPSGLAYPTDFNLDSIRAFTASVKRIKQITNNPSDEAILANHRLGKMATAGFVPNIACALLFANDPRLVIPGSMIRFQRIEGQRIDTGAQRNVVKDLPIEGRLPEMIEEAASILESQLREFSRLGKDGKFYRDSEYPREAWYEAIVNACVHRSYSLKGMNIFVKMFDDKLVVESPGSFPPLVTPQNIYEVHHRRNYFLMDALFYLDYVKCENEGTKRMRDSMRRSDLPEPEFVQQEVGEALVRVTLRNNHRMREKWIDSDAAAVVGPILAKTLSKDENRLINFCAEHGAIKARQAELLTGKTWQTADGILKGLVEKRIMDRKSKYPRDPHGHYVLRNVPPSP